MKLLFKLLLVLIILAGAGMYGAFQFLKKGDIPYAQLEARYANPASKFADLPGGLRVHYRDQGNPRGRPLLLIHGFGINLETWEPWVKLLSADYRLISLDLPGHGLTRTPPSYQPSLTSFADIAAQLVAVMGVERYTVVGNSMGGHTAWLLALRHAAVVEALVLSDAGGWYDAEQRDNAPLVFRIINDPRIAPYLAQLDPKPLMKNGLEAAFVDKSMVTNGMLNRYSDMALAPGHRELLGAITRSMSPEILASKEKLAGIKVPTLILWGDQDALISVDDAQKFKDAIPGSKVVIYRNIGHLPYEEYPEASARDLKDFLEGTQAPPQPAPAAPEVSPAATEANSD
jgi:pimeloyl-ACP methyl ester carboxylesterase